MGARLSSVVVVALLAAVASVWSIAAVGTRTPAHLDGAARPARAAGTGTAESTAESTAVALPFRAGGAVVADAVHGRAFVSGRTGDSSWATTVADGEGRIVRTLRWSSDPAGMALSPDSSTLYVALAAGHAVAAVNTSSYHVKTYDVAGCPLAVAVAAGLVWHSDSCDREPGSIGALDPRTGADHAGLYRQQTVGGLTASAGLPDLLVEYDGTRLRRLAVTGGGRPSVRSVAARAWGPGALALSPGGDRLLTPRGALDPRTLQTEELYPFQTPEDRIFFTAADVSSTGAVAVGGNDDEGAGHVLVYPPGQTVGPRRHVFRAAPGQVFAPQLVPDGLAVDGARVYAVTALPATDPDYRLHVFHERLAQDGWAGRHRLPLTQPAQIVADARHGRVFVGGGWYDDGVVVTDSRGRIVKVLQHLPGPTRLALSEDANRLFVATSRATSVAVVDTRTLRVRRVPLGADTCPGSVAPAVGLLWFTSVCDPDRRYLGAVDLRTGQVHRHLLGAVSGPLLSVPGRHGLLLLPRYDTRSRIAVTGGRHPTARRARGGTLSTLSEDALVSPDGLTVASIPYRNDTGDTGDTGDTVVTQATRSLAVTGGLRTGPRADAVAIRGDGLTAVGLPASHSLLLARQPVDQAAPRRRVHRGSWVTAGFAFGHRRLYTLDHNRGLGWSVGGFRMPPVRRLALTQERAVYASGDRVRVVAHVDAWGRAARRAVVLYARLPGDRHGQVVARGRADRFGNVRFSLPVRVRTRLTAVAPSAGALRRLVGGLTVDPRVRLRGDVVDLAGGTREDDVMPAGARPALDVQVSPAHAGQCLFVQLDAHVSRHRWRAVHHGCARIGPEGTVRYVLPDRGRLREVVRVRAVWKGGALNAPAATPWRTVTLR